MPWPLPMGCWTKETILTNEWHIAFLSVMLWMSACAESPSADSTPPDTTSETDGTATAATFEPATSVFRCRTAGGEIRLVTRTRENGLHVFLPPEIEGGYLDCDHDRRASIWEHAKLDGVSFRAAGNEPGWVLEIRDGDRLDLTYDYGQAELSVPIAETRSDTGSRITTYSGAAGERTMLVRLSAEGCSDTMSDETFPTRVEVQLEERTLSGCGRPLH